MGFMNSIKLLQGDCLDLMKSIPDESIDLICTDPPYKYLKHKLETDYNEEMFFNECWRVMKKDSILAFFGRGKSFYRWNYICEKIGFEFKEEVIWYKKYSSSPLLALQRVHETMSVLQKGNRRLNKVRIDKTKNDSIINPQALINDMKRILLEISKIKDYESFENFRKGEYHSGRKGKYNTTVGSNMQNRNRGYWSLAAHEKGKVLSSIIPAVREHYSMQHPTQKPIELLTKIILLCSEENNVVLDPFMGSGSTGVATLQTNRHFIGMEILPEYFKIATKRIQDEHDKTALFNKGEKI
jgi:site-specific DNA-methyltransferase (adenine-specific)